MWALPKNFEKMTLFKELQNGRLGYSHLVNQVKEKLVEN